MKKHSLLGSILLCVLVLSCFTMLLTVPVMGASSDVEILSYSWYTVTANDEAKTVREIVVMGELQNVGTSNIMYAYVIGSAFIDETKIATVSQEALGQNIQPGQKAPFRLVITAQNVIDKEEVEEEDLTDLTGVTDVDISVGYVARNDYKVSVNSTVSSKRESGTSPYTVTGLVTVNTEELLRNKEWVRSIKVIVTFYNSKGTVVSLGSTGVFGQSAFDPESVPTVDVNFKITPMDTHFGNDITHHEVFVQYYMAQNYPYESTPSQPAPPSSVFSPVATPTETPEINNPEFNTTWIIIIALIIAIITIPTILLLTRNKPTPTNN